MVRGAALVVLGVLLSAPGLSGQEPGQTERVPVPGTQLEIAVAFVPAGTFRMGSGADETGRDEDEGPVEEVAVSAFWMTTHEITHDQFAPYRFRRMDEPVGFSPEVPFDADAVTRPSPPYEDPSHGMEQGEHPATGMTRLAALQYARWLSEKTGRLFRLPTEAEWEYACRAGGGAAYGGAEDPAATSWYAENANGAYHPVGAKAANAWGLHDLSGNVAEWVLDEYVADVYASRAGGVVDDPVAGRPGRGRGVVRGGAFDDPADRIRCAERFPEASAWKRRDPQIPKSRWWNTDSPHVGFRLVSPAREYGWDEIQEYWTELLGAS